MFYQDKRKKDESHIQNRNFAALQRRLAIVGVLDEPNDERLARSIVFWVIGVFVAGLLWAAATPVYEIVTADGLILPLDGARPAQHLEGGVVAEVMVREGDTVAAGDVLIRMNIEEAQAALVGLQARKEALLAEAHRQKAILNTTTFNNTSSGPWSDQASILGIQEQVASAEARTLQSQVSLAEVELEAAIASLDGLRNDIELLTAARDRMVELASRGAASQTGLDNSSLALSVAMRSLATTQAEVKSAELRLHQAQLAQVQRLAERREIAAERLALVRMEMRNVDQEIAHIRPRIDRKSVVAPVNGQVQDIVVSDAGEVVAAGSVIATVVPVDGEMFAELEVPAHRIAEIRPGLKAVVKILTYDFARFGGIDAEVTHVSPTSAVDNAGAASYRVRLQLLKKATEPETVFQLRPGMTVTADLQIGKKTVLEFFLKPLRVLRDRALTEV